MRRIYLGWMIGVFGIIGTAYGAHLLIYHYINGNGLHIPSLLLLIFGAAALILFLALTLVTFAQKKKEVDKIRDVFDNEPKVNESVDAIPSEEVVIETPKEEPKKTNETRYTPSRNNSYRNSSSYSISTVYVKQIGYGPVLRVEGSRIIDMRTNTYYRIEGNNVTQDGYGIVYEIRGNQIKDAFGGYLYELSGNNINRVYGGFYAQISGNFITLFDLSKQFETSDSLSKKQILVVAVLLFGRY